MWNSQSVSCTMEVWRRRSGGVGWRPPYLPSQADGRQRVKGLTVDRTWTWDLTTDDSPAELIEARMRSHPWRPALLAGWQGSI